MRAVVGREREEVTRGHCHDRPGEVEGGVPSVFTLGSTPTPRPWVDRLWPKFDSSPEYEAKLRSHVELGFKADSGKLIRPLGGWDDDRPHFSRRGVVERALLQFYLFGARTPAGVV